MKIMSFRRVPRTPRLLPLVLACSLFSGPSFADDYEWIITKTRWGKQDENNFGRFVSAIGHAVERRACRTVDRCMKNAANRYRQTDPERMSFFADCADFPYFMRAYFAWKNQLPFGIATNMRAAKDNPREADIRYTPYGNAVSARMDFVDSGFRSESIVSILNTIIPNMISTAMYRVGYTGNDKGSLYADFYPVRIDRGGIMPGTVMYDANGHAGLIYKITDDGYAWYVDAHPDNSLTVGKFNIKVARSNGSVGAGFKKFRPQVLVDANESFRGNYEDGRLVPVSNAQLPDYSHEQYFGTNGKADSDWKAAKFVFNNKEVTFHEYVRLKLSLNANKQDPVVDFKSQLSEICLNLTDRLESVQVAIRNSIDQKPHPEKLPANIYGSEGDWETYSTPGRDVSLRIMFKYLMGQSTDFVTRWKAKDPSLVYTGANLAADLLAAYQTESKACVFSYNATDGRKVTLNLENARQRAYLFSFDPYHCVERRWGAIGAELSSCKETPDKALWYDRTQQLRNHTDRKLDVRTDLTLEQWKDLVPNVGVEVPESLDIEDHLRKLQ